MKTVFLKRVAIVVIAALTMSLPAAAQKKGDMAAGLNVLFGTTKGYSNLGLGAKFRYNVTNPIRLSAEFDYFLKKDFVNFWDVSVYGNYLFPIADKLVVYPSIGLGVVGEKYNLGIPEEEIFGIKIGGSASENKFAASIGGGADYAITPNIALNFELRVKTITNGWFNILVGASYKF